MAEATISRIAVKSELGFDSIEPIHVTNTHNFELQQEVQNFSVNISSGV